ncbi:MAG: hypothetical protein A2901_06325 [Elusimicrobia bacterium RIFCSPLOWO2_01_FULL_54_10]|nr:MAG: hypothetical protein A2901_06325 [Elusimicrobia bacterium RIFCSPLOWO2_01_FULL_54_10]
MILEEKIPVQIFGQTYEILGNPSETLYYISLARLVEDKMKEIMAHTNVVSTQKVAVLAALNIAEELLRERNNKDAGGKIANKKVEDLLKKLDSVIREPGAAPEPKAVRRPEAENPHRDEAEPQELQLI